LFWTVLVIFGWFIWSRFAEIDKLIHTLRSGRPLWVTVALAAQFSYFVIFAGVYWSAFDTVRVQFRLRDLVRLTFAATFVNTTISSGGTAGTTLYVDHARRHRQSVAQTAAGALLVITSDYVGFGVLLTLGLFALIQQHSITRIEVISALIMYGLIFALLAVLSTSIWFPQGLQRLLGGVQNGVNWVSGAVNRLLRRTDRPNFLPTNWAERNAAEFISAGNSLKRNPRDVVRTAAIAFLAHLCEVLTLQLLFHAFSQPISFSFALTLYVMTILFTVVSPTPSGVGVVETVMPAIYVSLGVPLEAGTVINLAFRGISFWLPLLIGFVALRQETKQSV
jgi:uncharacterized protein (TIRG00374 family)